ncbi:MAG TPA: hypothetical protein VHH14_03855 [Solirubrobacterales bacterium]|nr:hypothetical protein [Solirubrobacterales bacterium]
MNPIAHLRHNLVAYLALFVALGTGTAYAAGQITSKDIARNAVKAKHIKDGQVRGAELAANAVTGAKVADGSLGGADVADGSLGGADVADNSLTGADLDESSLQLPTPPTPPGFDPSGYAKVVARGFLTGPGPLWSGNRCNAVSTEVPGVTFADQVVISPGSLTEEVVYTAAITDLGQIAYQACYTGSAEVNIGGDVRYMVLRMQE